MINCSIWIFDTCYFLRALNREDCLTIWKIKILRKWKKTNWKYHFTYVYHKWLSYDVWSLRHGIWQTGFIVILAISCTFTPPPPPPNKQENQNFEKMKISSGDIIIWHKCTKNHDHILYCSLDMAHDRCNFFFFFHFGLFFELLPP